MPPYFRQVLIISLLYFNCSGQGTRIFVPLAAPRALAAGQAPAAESTGGVSTIIFSTMGVSTTEMTAEACVSDSLEAASATSSSAIRPVVGESAVAAAARDGSNGACGDDGDGGWVSSGVSTIIFSSDDEDDADDCSSLGMTVGDNEEQEEVGSAGDEELGRGVDACPASAGQGALAAAGSNGSVVAATADASAEAVPMDGTGMQCLLGLGSSSSDDTGAAAARGLGEEVEAAVDGVVTTGAAAAVAVGEISTTWIRPSSLAIAACYPGSGDGDCNEVVAGDSLEALAIGSCCSWGGDVVVKVVVTPRGKGGKVAEQATWTLAAVAAPAGPLAAAAYEIGDDGSCCVHHAAAILSVCGQCELHQGQGQQQRQQQVGQQALNSQEQLRLQLLVQAETKEERDGDAEGHADVVEEMLLDVVDRCQESWDDLIRKATKGKVRERHGDRKRWREWCRRW